jgi:hypothetical protein
MAFSKTFAPLKSGNRSKDENIDSRRTIIHHGLDDEIAF